MVIDQLHNSAKKEKWGKCGYRVTHDSIANDPTQETISESHASSKCPELKTPSVWLSWDCPFSVWRQLAQGATWMNPLFGG